MIQELAVGQLYSNEEIFKSLGLSNAGGIRTCSRNGTVTRAAVMTSLQGLHGAGENPYHDRLENGVLIYTAAGKVGEQTLSGVNKRLIEQRTLHFPIHGFVLTASRRDKSVGPQRWKYLGLLQYLRHYPDNQIGSDGNIRKVWLFELRIHPEPQHFPPAMDTAVWDDVRRSPNGLLSDDADDDEIVGGQDLDSVLNVGQVEHIRSRLLAMEPRQFELFIRDLLEHSGFGDVCVTRYSADGGVDVNARAKRGIWVLENTLLQVQAKRWLHSVGRREVAELRGSLQPFARGAVVTTSHFSRAAIKEASEPGKNPIVLVDGFSLSRVVLDNNVILSQ
jgi:hypothetical protein